MHALALSVLYLLLVLLSCALAQDAPTASLVPPSTIISGSSYTSFSGSSSASSSSASTLPATSTSTASYPSLSGYSSCVVQCLALAVSSSNCTSVVDVNCYCETGRTVFESSIENCIESQCPTQLSSVESLSQQFCNRANTSVSLSWTSPVPSSTSSSTFSSSSSLSSLTSSAASSTTSHTSSASASSAASMLAPAGLGMVLIASLSATVIAMAVGALSI